MKRLFTICLVFSQWTFETVHAGSRPSWTLSQTKEDLQYKYYVGRSELEEDETKAINHAIRDAYGAAIRENYGIETEINSHTYESEKDQDLIRRTFERSTRVNIVDFEMMDTYTEEDGGRWKAWALFRYGKKAIAVEKERQRAIPQVSSELYEGTADTGQVRGVIEIDTVPAGAKVTVDGLPVNFLVTPMRLAGQLSLGRHKITIDHPAFFPIEEEIHLVSQAPLKIKKVLKPAYGMVSVSTEPSEATVWFGEKRIGKTPLNEIRVRASLPQKIRIEHPLTETMTLEVIVERDEIRALKPSLTYKAAYLTISSLTPDVEVKVNGLNAGELPIKRFRTNAGECKVSFSKVGYETIEKVLFLKAGETKTISDIQLKELPVDPPVEEHYAKGPGFFSRVESWLSDLAYYRGEKTLAFEFGVGCGYMGSPIQSAKLHSLVTKIELEARAYGLFSVNVFGGYITGKGGNTYYWPTTEDEYGIGGYEYGVAAQFYPTRYLFVGYELAVADYEHTNRLPSTTSSYSSYSSTYSTTRYNKLSGTFSGIRLGIRSASPDGKYGLVILGDFRNYKFSSGASGQNAFHINMGLTFGL